MGITWNKYLHTHLWKEDEPDSAEPIKYDPRFGFDGPRDEVRVMATIEEMDSAGIHRDFRDQCAHFHIQLKGCNKNNAPLFYRCNSLRAEMRDCYWDTYVRDMKEFERERRLNVRERRIRERS